MRVEAINPDVPERSGGYVLAVTHISHLEVVIMGVRTSREIRWVTRQEFYRRRPVAWFLRAAGCIRVNRQGIPASTIRQAVSCAQAGGVVGIFPEGGVVKGSKLVIRGGPVKRGMCSIAIRAGVPIIPAVVLGVEKLNCVGPWLPFRRGRLWVAFGEPISAPEGVRSNRASRRELADRTCASFRELYGRLQREFGVRDCDVP